MRKASCTLDPLSLQLSPGSFTELYINPQEKAKEEQIQKYLIQVHRQVTGHQNFCWKSNGGRKWSSVFFSPKLL